MESLESPRTGGKVLRRQLSSRLQMHAPASIQIVPAPARASEWKVAIPLLSPLDISAIPPSLDRTAPEPDGKRAREEPYQGQSADEAGERSARLSAWQHPAAPFYYEPVPGNAPVFALPHCA